MRARALIIDTQKILLIHRIKNGKEYYILPGGGKEDNESLEECLNREIKEETNLDIEIGKMVHQDEDENGDKHYFFLANNFKGELKLGGPESKKNSNDNKYILEWHSLKKLDKINLRPTEIKKTIADLYFDVE